MMSNFSKDFLTLFKISTLSFLDVFPLQSSKKKTTCEVDSHSNSSPSEYRLFRSPQHSAIYSDFLLQGLVRSEMSRSFLRQTIEVETGD